MVQSNQYPSSYSHSASWLWLWPVCPLCLRIIPTITPDGEPRRCDRFGASSSPRSFSCCNRTLNKKSQVVPLRRGSKP
jgi:hypothetical protein